MLIRHDTRYKLAALTAELWGRGHDIDGVEEADAASTGGGQRRGSRLPQMTAASVVFPTVFRQARPRADSACLRVRHASGTACPAASLVV